MNRFTKNSTKKKFELNFNQTNRQLQIPEKTTPPNIVKLDKKDIKPFVYMDQADLTLMIGIVFTPIGSTDSSPEGFKNGNYFVHLGDNTPGNQNGFLIIAKYNEPNINS